MYTINIGEYTVGSTVYEDRCLSASIGGIGLQCEEIVWEGTDHQPYDYKALFNEVEEEIDVDGVPQTVVRKEYTGEFVLDPIPIPIDNSIEIAELKQKLADTDYCVIKVAEGSATLEDYAELIEQRKEWRARINELGV